MAAQRKSNGFTLAELLVAMTIFAVCMASLSKVFRTLLTARQRVEMRMDGARRRGNALRELEQDMACALIPEGLPDGSMKTAWDEEGEAKGAEGTKVRFWTVRPRFVGAGTLVAAVVRVTYRLVPENGPHGLRLARTEYDPVTGAESEAVLISGLEAVSWSFNTGTRYTKEWASRKKLPKSVRLRIRLNREESQERVWDSEFIVGVSR